MAGIMPTGGVVASQTINAEASGEYAANCLPRFYRVTCNPKLDPSAMNAMISEIINLTNCDGDAYDCGALDNLCQTITKMFQRRLHRIAFFGVDSWALGVFDIPDNGNFQFVSTNSFNIPNTGIHTIKVLITPHLHAQIESTLPAGDDGQFQVTWTLFSDAAHTTPIVNVHNIYAGNTTEKKTDFFTSNAAYVFVPPGGLTVYPQWELIGNSQTNWRINELFVRFSADGAYAELLDS